ncbi:MAG: DMT family transporter, partial [Candidatus Limnocylindria bacterium]
LVGGSNFVAVRFSNRELPPFFGAGIRFVAASLLLLVLAGAMRLRLPRGRALLGAFGFGVLNFGVTYALAYWALQTAPAALASTLVALTPLLTFLLAVTIRDEAFHWRGLAGGVVAIVGVAIIFRDQVRDVSLGPLVALALQPLAIAIGTIWAKRLPHGHPVATNAVAMAPGAALLLALAWVAKETPTLPSRPETWLALGYLIVATAILFVGFFFVVRRWTASATSYATVMFPVVTLVVGAITAGEGVTLSFVVGAALVMLGVYVGALAPRQARLPARAAA